MRLLRKQLAAQIEVEAEASATIEVVHLQPQRVTAVPVAGMDPFGAHGESVEAGEGGIDEVEQHRIGAIVDRAARSGKGIEQERLGGS